MYFDEIQTTLTIFRPSVYVIGFYICCITEIVFIFHFTLHTNQKKNYRDATNNNHDFKIIHITYLCLFSLVQLMRHTFDTYLMLYY